MLFVGVTQMYRLVYLCNAISVTFLEKFCYYYSTINNPLRNDIFNKIWYSLQKCFEDLVHEILFEFVQI